jgi:hypothetical protein
VDSSVGAHTVREGGLRVVVAANSFARAARAARPTRIGGSRGAFLGMTDHLARDEVSEEPQFSAFTSATSFSMDFFASPKSISVLGL